VLFDWIFIHLKKLYGMFIDDVLLLPLHFNGILCFPLRFTAGFLVFEIV
jgi:hypothetical protein